MFELGARPHPPQQLYRAYLDQSDVFVGIYWEHYGWIAPDEEISGLEDEYRLAPAEMPKLIYLKQPAEREPRLAELLGADPRRRHRVVHAVLDGRGAGRADRADLAILLAERFDASRGPRDAGGPSRRPPRTDHIPVPYTDAVGREQEVATLLDWLGDDAQRVVTLVGPGGIGKSRLAIEVARSAGEPFDRVTFVMLEHVTDPADVLPEIARELGVRDTGDRPLSEQLGVARAGRRDLIVLDSFEQVLTAASDVCRC